MTAAKNTTGLTENLKQTNKNSKSMDWFNKGISKDNVIKALCFTQTDNTKDAVVRFCPSNCNHQNRLLAKIDKNCHSNVSGHSDKTDKRISEGHKKQNKRNR